MTMRVGVVGSGFMGRTWSEVAANHAAGTTLVAVAGGRRAADLAADYGVPLDGSPEALIARTDVDLVVLASPPAVHRVQALAAAAAGKHILVEKPMAQDGAECAAMVDACRTAGVRLSVVSQHRFRDTPAAARRLIADGAIGDVRMIRLTGAEVGWWDLKARGDEWKLDPAQQTAWASWSAHGCDLIRWLSGSEPVRAYARITNFSGDPPDVGQSAMAHYRLRSGAIVQVLMTYETPKPGLPSNWEFVIVGSAGILRLDPYGQLRLGRGDDWEVVAEMPAFDPLDANDPIRLRAYAWQLEDLVAAIREGHDPLVSGEEGRRTTAMLTAAEASARTGAAVALDVETAGRSSA
jgi:UDP-N-acetyl-2-amino-2-deoxyglucuronate dehydrogenase